MQVTKIIRWCTVLVVMMTVMSVQAATVAYISNGTDANQTAVQNQLNAVFGVGGWTNYSFSTAPTTAAALSAFSFVYVEGGVAQGSTFGNYIETASTQTLLQNYVTSGGRLFLNGGRTGTGTQANTLNLGFGGVQLVDSNPGTGFATSPTAPGVNGPYGNAGTAWTGTPFAGDRVVSPSGTALITSGVGGTGNTLLLERTFGSGMVWFGGLTSPNLQTPAGLASILRRNLLDYMANGAAPGVPEPGTLALLACGLGSVAWARRRRRLA